MRPATIRRWKTSTTSVGDALTITPAVTHVDAGDDETVYDALASRFSAR